jgi:hypothetical protein
MVVFGGIFEITRELNDTLLFDISSEQWRIQQEEKEQEDASPTKNIFMASGQTPYLTKKLTKSGKDRTHPYGLTKTDSPLKSKAAIGLTINTSVTTDKKTAN